MQFTIKPIVYILLGFIIVSICYSGQRKNALSGASVSTQYLPTNNKHRIFMYYQYEGQSIEEKLYGEQITRIRNSSVGNFNINVQYEYLVFENISLGVSASPLWIIALQSNKGNLLVYMRYTTNIYDLFKLQEVAGVSVGFRPYLGLHVSKQILKKIAIAVGAEYYSGTNQLWSPRLPKSNSNDNSDIFPGNYYSYEHNYKELRLPVSIQWRYFMLSVAMINPIKDKVQVDYWRDGENDHSYGLSSVKIDRKFEIRFQGNFLWGNSHFRND